MLAAGDAKRDHAISITRWGSRPTVGAAVSTRAMAVQVMMRNARPVAFPIVVARMARLSICGNSVAMPSAGQDAERSTGVNGSVILPIVVILATITATSLACVPVAHPDVVYLRCVDCCLDIAMAPRAAARRVPADLQR